MTEREFVLNNFYTNQLKEMEDTLIIDVLKQTYKNICENTSDESDNDNFIGKDSINQFVQIAFKNIANISEVGDAIFICDNKSQSSHKLIGIDSIKFKQWFERKRGGK